MPRKYRDTREMIEQNVEQDAAGCWLWQLARNHSGYGLAKVERRTMRAHRVAYEAFVGPIPDGLTIDHLCQVTSCVNPAHLEAVTHQVNILRGPRTIAGRNATRTHCPQGHAYDAANTRHRPNGKRDCRACQRASSARRLTA